MRVLFNILFCVVELQHDLHARTVQMESYKCQLKEHQDILTSKETALLELKTQLEKVKAGHDDEIKVCYFVLIFTCNFKVL